MNRLENDLTQGHVTKQLITFAIPFLLSNMLQALYNVVDMLIVGWFVGPDGITAVNNSGVIVMIFCSLVIGFSVGGNVLVAQYKGAGKTEELQKSISTLVTLFTGLGVVLGIAGIIFSPYLLSLVGIPEVSYAQANDYLMIMFAGIIFDFIYNGLGAIQRGLGDSKRPLYFALIATVANIVLDLVFVGGMGMKSAGAAYATVIAKAISAILAIAYLAKNSPYFSLSKKMFIIDKDKLKRIMQIGLPAGIQQALIFSGFLFINSLINSYGVEAAAGAAIGNKIDSFCILPCIAMSAAVSSMAGQNIGAGRFDRAFDTMKKSMYMCLGACILIFIALQLFAPYFAMLFNDDPQVIASATLFQKTASYGYFALGLLFSMNGLLTGSGNTLMVLIISILNVLIIRVPVALILSINMGFGLAGVYASMSISPYLGCVVAMIYIATGRWKKQKLGISKEAVIE